MSETTIMVAAAAVNKVARTNYLSWTPEMELQLVKAVSVHKAHIKSKLQSETYEVKYNRVIIDLWGRRVFSEQGSSQTWSTVQAKFRSLCTKFCNAHGYGEGGARVNLSALPDEDSLSEMDDLLHKMCKEISKQVEVTDIEKKTKMQKKKTVSSITDVIIGGGGKDGLLKLSKDIVESGEDIISSSTSNFIKGISAVTCEPSSRKRQIGKEELEGEDLMKTFAAQFRKDDEDEAARMQSLHNLIKQSGDATTSAIESGNREAAKSSMLMISAIAGLASAMQNK